MKKRSSSIFKNVKESCVYFLENEYNTALYIGKVSKGGFSNRMVMHSKMSYFKEVTKIKVIPCENETELTILECYYINKLKPVQCSQYIYGESRIVIDESIFEKVTIWERE